MRIAIVGAGGVGGYFGGRLAAAAADVHFIARGAHLAALRSNGLTIRSPQGDTHVPTVNATDDAASIGPVDLVLFCVKLYDMQSAAATVLPPLVGPSTMVVPTQNGVDAVSALSKAVGAEHVAGGTTWLSAVIDEPGVIRHVAMGRLAFGAIRGEHPAVLREFHDVCVKAGVDAKLSDRILLDIWAKFVRLTVFSGITCIARSPIGVCLEEPGLFALLDRAVHESVSVARGMQIPLPHSAYDDTLTGLRALPPHAKASMLEDLERGRRLELPWLSGAMARIGDEVGVETPTHDLFVTLLSPHANGH
ncbi:MAG TPA: 2-dehydropantoate 2-reductase [Vicinamibacterales bacterium]|jgi:2-dehydropantoate 2-reductase|nr:2-dehydropantoate 2-reductase [Vicinamibacterales bacterium]